MVETPDSASGARAPRPEVPGLRYVLAVILLTLTLFPGGVRAQPAASDSGTALLRPAGPAVVRAADAALLVGRQEGGDLPLSLLAVPLRKPRALAFKADRGQLAEVALVLDLGPLPPQAAVAAATTGLTVTSYAVGPDLEVLDRSAHLLRFSANHRATLEREGCHLLTLLRLPAGEYRLRVLVRAGDAFALGSAAVTLPQGRLVLPPLVPDRRRLTALALSPEAEADYPLILAGRALVPAARPGLGEDGAEGRAYLVYAGEAEGESPGAAEVSVHLRSLADGGETTLAARTEAPLPLAAGLTALPVAFDVAGLAAGHYRLTLAWPGAPRGEILTPAVPVKVGDAGPVPSGALSSDVEFASDDAPDFAGVLEPPAEAVHSAEQRAGAEPLAAAYRRTLRQLGGHGGDLQAWGAAAGGLLQLERQALARGDLDVLGRAQTRVAEELGRAGGPWALLPLLLVHTDLALEYRRRGESVLASHAAAAIHRLAAQAGAEPALVPLAATALGRLGDGYLRSGLRKRAEEALLRAQALAPGQPASGLLLAALYEKEGRFEEAAAVLRGVLDGRPDEAVAAEVSLRLGLAHARRGAHAEARQHLEALAFGKPLNGKTQWIAQLASQELVRLDVREGRLDQAAPRLRQALERWPGQPSLLVQQAYLLDLESQAVAARELIAAVDRAAVEPALEETEDGLGPRDRYNRWPRDPLRDASRALRHEALAAGQELHDLLGPEPAP